MFDLLLQEVAKKFGLGNKVSWILSTLLSYLFNRSHGGLSGFLEQLTRNGLGKVVNSWLSKDEPMAINAAQVDRVMDHGVINNLASQLDMNSGSISMAVAQMLPKVVSELTPNGIIPDTIPPDIAYYIKEDNRAETRLSGLTHSQLADYNITPESTRKESGFNWWWLLLLPLLLLLGWCTLKQTEQAPVAVLSSTGVSESEVPAASIATFDSNLSISHEADYFNISGTVADDTTKESILNQLNAVINPDKVSGDIDVDPAAGSTHWLMKLPGVLPALKDAPGATLRLEGNDIVLDGNLEQGTIDNLTNELKNVFGTDYNIRSQAVGLVSSPQIPDRVFESGDAVSAMQDEVSEVNVDILQDRTALGTVTDENLVHTLSMTRINFASGDYTITQENMTLLSDVVQVVKAAPVDTRIQVGGHTDNTGSSQINIKLSEQRAQAVVDALVNLGVDAAMLRAKGYGESQPIADNSSKEGRRQNRRMEFTLQ